MGVSGKIKLINATPFHERSAIEVIISLRLFPVTKESHLRISAMLSGFSGLLHEKGNREFSVSLL